MQAACEAGDVFAWLEGGAGGARHVSDALVALYAAVREPWLVRALLQYHARTGSVRALTLLARAPEPHARQALDALAEQLRGEPAARHHALAALAQLVARRPPWLHLVVAPSPVARELMRCARREREPVPLLNALLALAALLPAAPALAPAHAAELAELVTRAPPEEASAAVVAQLQLGTRAVFLAAYETHPCTLVEALRAVCAGRERAAAALALARGVALHPALLTGSRRPCDQPHDVLAEYARLTLPTLPTPPPPPPPPPPETPLPDAASPDSMPLVCRSDGSGAQAGQVAGGVRPGAAGWFALGERSGAEAPPHTPLPEREREPEPEPEPEPAVEATPENTPARLARQAFHFPPADSSAVRPLLGRTPPPSASASSDACSARLQRVQAERKAHHHSPVPIGGPALQPPPSAARPEPRHPPPDIEDTEVRELTARAGSAGSAGGAWSDVTQTPPPLPPPPAPRPPRARAPARAGDATRDAGGGQRAASCGPVPSGGARRHVAVQTVDVWPEPYEFLVADYCTALPDNTLHLDKQKATSKEGGAKFSHNDVVDPTERLDRYLADLYAGRGTAGGGRGELAEQLALAHAQLMYERWRCDAHAERNRRLLGRCRAVRALELDNAALQARVLDLTAERDLLRERASERAPAPAPASPAAAAGAGAGDALEREVAAERAARLRAEAALRAAEAGRARDAAELQRTRGETFEAARHVEALGRAALAAERRAEHVRRLRRELLLVAEREARLAEAVRGALSAAGAGMDSGTERALRAACARAEAEAEAAGARCEAAQARAQELEAGAAARDAAVAELKRAGRAAGEEAAARLRALHDKYAALQRVVRAGAARRLQCAASASASASASSPPA